MAVELILASDAIRSAVLLTYISRWIAIGERLWYFTG